MEQQTAVEYLFEQLWETPKDKFTWNAILEKAKEMEKEQNQILIDWTLNAYGFINNLETNKMENDPWYVKLKRWFNLQRWVLMCRTRWIWDLNYEHNIFKKLWNKQQ